MPPSTIFCNVIQTKIKDKIVIENNNKRKNEKACDASSSEPVRFRN